MKKRWLLEKSPVVREIGSGIGGWRQNASGLLAIVASLMIVGCDGPVTPSKPQNEEFQVEIVDVTKLPPVDDLLPPLDDGRVKVSMPAGWKLGEAVKERLAWSYMKAGRPYPAIIVSAAGEDDVPTLTLQDLPAFEKKLQEKQDAEGVPLTQKAHAIQVGGFVGVEYVRRGKTDSGKAIDQLILETTSGGRKYRIEMHALMGTALESRPIVLSVANSLKFLPAAEVK